MTVTPLTISRYIDDVILTSFLVFCGRCVQWSSGSPWMSSAVRTLFVLSSGIMEGTANRLSSARSCLVRRERREMD